MDSFAVEAASPAGAPSGVAPKATNVALSATTNLNDLIAGRDSNPHALAPWKTRDPRLGRAARLPVFRWVQATHRNFTATLPGG
jgi:hypothetical protein